MTQKKLKKFLATALDFCVSQARDCKRQLKFFPEGSEGYHLNEKLYEYYEGKVCAFMELKGAIDKKELSYIELGTDVIVNSQRLINDWSTEE